MLLFTYLSKFEIFFYISKCRYIYRKLWCNILILQNKLTAIPVNVCIKREIYIIFGIADQANIIRFCHIQLVSLLLNMPES